MAKSAEPASVSADGRDLSGDRPMPPLASPQDALAFEESLAKRARQTNLYYWAVGSATVLFLIASIMSFLLICSASHDQHWQLPLLAAAFLIPPTLIMIALIRAEHAASSKADEHNHLPLLHLIKELVLAVKEASKAFNK